MKIQSVTPVLFVDRVEPTRDFFLQLGFTILFDVPEGDHLGFVGLMKDGAQVMVETRGNTNESAQVQALTKESRRAVLFIEVDDLDAAMALVKDAKVVAERHTTFYGADEISFEEPGGNVVTFARIKRA